MTNSPQGGKERRRRRRCCVDESSIKKETTPTDDEERKAGFFTRQKGRSLRGFLLGQRDSVEFYQQRNEQEKQSWEAVKELVESEHSRTYREEEDEEDDLSVFSRNEHHKDELVQAVTEISVRKIKEPTRLDDTNCTTSSFRLQRRRVFAPSLEQDDESKSSSMISSLSSGSSLNSSVSSTTRSRAGQEEMASEDDKRPTKPTRVVCQCCYQDIAQPVTRSIVCSVATDAASADHSFCTDCVRRYVESWVFGGAYYTVSDNENAVTALPCLAGTSCCAGYFTAETVSLAVSPRVAEQYHEKLVRVTQAAADDDVMTKSRTTNNSWNNKKSDYQLAEPSSPFTTIRPATADKRPQQSSTDVMDQCYRQAEEALTHAKLRQCPNCAVFFLKEPDSCNKMKCPSCRHSMCYICRHPIQRKGYDHFCQHQYDSCNVCTACPLWTKQDEDRDREHLRKVAVTHANQVWEDSLLSSSSHEIRLNVDLLLQENQFCTEIV